jgi:hypothetical protein
MTATPDRARAAAEAQALGLLTEIFDYHPMPWSVQKYEAYGVPGYRVVDAIGETVLTKISNKTIAYLLAAAPDLRETVERQTGVVDAVRRMFRARTFGSTREWREWLESDEGCLARLAVSDNLTLLDGDAK